MAAFEVCVRQRGDEQKISKKARGDDKGGKIHKYFMCQTLALICRDMFSIFDIS